MNETTPDLEYEIRLPRPAPSTFEREQQAFQRLLPELLRTHMGQFVAISGEKVVDSGDDREALILRVWAKLGYIPIYVGMVDPGPETVERIPHYRHR